jgi:hypothetical protein
MKKQPRTLRRRHVNSGDDVTKMIQRVESLTNDEREKLRAALLAHEPPSRPSIRPSPRRDSELTAFAAPALSLSAAAGLLAATAFSGPSIPILAAAGTLLGSAAVFKHRKRS